MKIEPVRGPKFAALVRKYGTGAPSFATPLLEGSDPADPLAILLSNYLLWESTPKLAADALARIARVVVDANDLRVMLEREVIETIGEKYPFVDERAQRLRSTLNDIFRRQHRTSLDHLRNASRKDQRGYLEGLAEIPPFVSGRTMLVAFELPAAIVDDTTVEVLHQQGVVEPRATTLDVVQWIGKNHRLEELPKVHHALSQLVAEAWSGAGRNGTRIRDAYLMRHAGFQAAIDAEKRRVEEERLAKVRDAEAAAERKRLEEIAREEDRIRQKRDAEAARVRAKQEREAARVAAIAERERRQAEREALRIARARELERKAVERAKLEERRRRQREANERKAAIRKAKREKLAKVKAEKAARLAKAKALKAAKLLKAKKLKDAKLAKAKKLARLKALKAAKVAKLKAAKVAKLKAAKVAKQKAAKVAKLKAAKKNKSKPSKSKPSKSKSPKSKSPKSNSFGSARKRTSGARSSRRGR